MFVIIVTNDAELHAVLTFAGMLGITVQECDSHITVDCPNEQLSLDCFLQGFRFRGRSEQ